MFDVGFTEILLLSLVGLLVLGPERLPRVARTLGGMARKARGSWLSLKRSIEAEMRAEDLKEPLYIGLLGTRPECYNRIRCDRYVVGS